MSPTPSSKKTWDERILGIGGSAVVSRYDDTSVLKGYVVWLDGRKRITFEAQELPKRSLDREREVYERLGTHSCILGYYGVITLEPETHSLRLEYASNGDLRSFIRSTEPDSISIPQRLTWAIGLASGLSYIHSKGVFHCDFSCRNIFVTRDQSIKIGDFGGAKIDKGDPYGAEEPWYELPLRGRLWDERPYVKRELFALGCAIYEIMTWKKPFADLNAEGVEARFACEEFPDIAAVFGGSVIRECWEESFETADGVKVALQALPTIGY
jgi:serine/threonine protein kinase